MLFFFLFLDPVLTLLPFCVRFTEVVYRTTERKGGKKRRPAPPAVRCVCVYWAVFFVVFNKRKGKSTCRMQVAFFCVCVCMLQQVDGK